MNETIPADPRARKRAILIVLTLTLVGFVSLSLFQRFLSEMDALATVPPQLAFEKLYPVRMVVLTVTLVSAVTLAGSFAYASWRVYRAGQWPPSGWQVLWERPIRTGRRASVPPAMALVVRFSQVHCPSMATQSP